MTTAAVSLPSSPVSLVPSPRGILWAGLACGGLDIVAAMSAAAANNGTPLRVLHSVASALLGPRAFQGGAATAALGLFMHLCVAFIAAAVFYALSRKLPAILKGAVPAGLAYGALVYATMYWAVIPLAALFRRLYLDNVAVRFPPFALQAFAIHLFFVGLPIALATRHFATRQPSNSIP
jgi:hypothetical protein